MDEQEGGYTWWADISPWFWDSIDRTKQDGNLLDAYLRTLPFDAVRRFALEWHHAAYALWCAPYTDYLVYTSDDDIEDVTKWIVGQGRALYERVGIHPQDIAGCEAAYRAKRQIALDVVADRILSEHFNGAWNLYDDYNAFAKSGRATISEYWPLSPEHSTES